MDWGTAKPFSIGWYVVSEGAVLAAKDGFPEVRLPKGAIVRFAEWYGWSGEADTGCRMSSSEVAREVLKLEAEMDLPPIDVRVADPQMWASQDGPSPQQNMRSATNGVFVLRQGRRDRKANYTEVINRLVGEPDEHGVVRPMFYVTANCRHFWRTVPGLVLDTLEPDKGPSTRTQEDHIYDEVGFGLATYSRVTTAQDRYRDEMLELASEFSGGGVSRDPYAVRSRRGR
jgi:hypothetical protein